MNTISSALILIKIPLVLLNPFFFPPEQILQKQELCPHNYMKETAYNNMHLIEEHGLAGVLEAVRQIQQLLELFGEVGFICRGQSKGATVLARVSSKGVLPVSHCGVQGLHSCKITLINFKNKFQSIPTLILTN